MQSAYSGIDKQYCIVTVLNFTMTKMQFFENQIDLYMRFTYCSIQQKKVIAEKMGN
jgi:hypothetical protein